MSWFFIPIREASNPKSLLIEADDLSEATNRTKTFPGYYKNFNKLSFDKQKRIGCNYLLEEEFIERYGTKSDIKRNPEEIFDCASREGVNNRGESLCGCYSKEIEDNVCVIHVPRFEFDLPKNCPYRTRKSDYVELIDEK